MEQWLHKLWYLFVWGVTPGHVKNANEWDWCYADGSWPLRALETLNKILNWLLKWRAVRPGLEWYLNIFGVNWQSCCWISNYLQRCQKRLEETWELQLSRCNKVLDFFLSLAIFNNRTDLFVKGKFRVKNNTCVSWTAAVGANCVVAVVMLLRQCAGCSLGLNFEFTISSCVRR